VDKDGTPIEEIDVKRLSLSERDALFKINFVVLCKDAFGELTVDEFGRLHFDEHKFSTLYDKLIEYRDKVLLCYAF
jgi:hypothetical protein